MREILFRGKRTDSGEWAEGCLLYDAENNKAFIAEHFEDEAAYLRKVFPETVGQYTGLTDKYGKKIFEGDIIKQEYALSREERAIISVIEYGISYAYSDVCGVCQRFSDGSGIAMLSVSYKSGLVYCEIIGNIHDNPELLKGGGQE